MQRVAVLERHHLRHVERLPGVLGFEHNLATLQMMQDLLHTLQTPDQIRPEKALATRADVQHRFGRLSRVAQQESGVQPNQRPLRTQLISCIRVPFPVSDGGSQAAP